jgi:hypothetical protein
MNRYMCPGAIDKVWFIPEATKKEEILCPACGTEMEMID